MNTESCRARKKSPQRAFTLVELLVVIALIVLLAGLTVPAYSTFSRSQSVNTAGQVVIDQLNLARQTAIAQNKLVEVRFYRLPDYSAPATTAPTVYRSMQTFLIRDGQSVALDKVTDFPPTAALNTNVKYTSLLKLTPNTPTVSIPTYQTNYSYLQFRFKPSGATDLDETQKWFLTLNLAREAGNLPANFVTVQIDPVTGRVRAFKP